MYRCGACDWNACVECFHARKEESGDAAAAAAAAAAALVDADADVQVGELTLEG